MNQIFVEAKDKNMSESLFIKTVIKHFFDKNEGDDKNADYRLVCCDGWTKLKNVFEHNASFKDKFTKGNNLLIFDADANLQDANDGGFLNRKAKLQEWVDNATPIFLWPNNHDDGTFENLLERIINPKHKVLLTCFDKYEMCIKMQNANGNSYVVPNIKAKMYAYRSTVPMGNKARDEFSKGY